jgi:Ser/Thr protein kinase RdoA (MazF antagonist)
MTSDPLRRVAAGFGLGEIRAVEPVPHGLMNPNWQITTTRGRYAVKQLRDATPDAVRRQHELLPRLAKYGIPAVRPCRRPSGDTLLPVEDAWFTAAPWADGTHRAGPAMTLAACTATGDLLGRLHLALADLLPAAPDSLPGVVATAAEADAELARLAVRAARSTAETGGTEFDRFAIQEIARRRALLRRVADRRPADAPALRPVGWTHGDIQQWNLLFDGDAVSAVLDWDRLDVRPLGLEVVRSATVLYSTDDDRRIDLDRVAAFTRAYRRHVAISDAELADAAHRRWWSLTCEAWHLRLHYDENDGGCDHLFVRVGRVLRWWTAHPGDLTAALTS